MNCNTWNRLRSPTCGLSTFFCLVTIHYINSTQGYSIRFYASDFFSGLLYLVLLCIVYVF